jgi:hypothetical protein
MLYDEVKFIFGEKKLAITLEGIQTGTDGLIAWELITSITSSEPFKHGIPFLPIPTFPYRVISIQFETKKTTGGKYLLKTIEYPNIFSIKRNAVVSELQKNLEAYRLSKIVEK